MTSTLEKPAVRPRRVATGRAALEAARRRPSRKWITSWIAVAVLLALWQIAPSLGWVERTFLPPLSRCSTRGGSSRPAASCGPTCTPACSAR